VIQIKWWQLGAVLIVALGAGFFIGTKSGVGESELAGIRVLREVEVAGLCGNALNLLDARREKVARVLLETRLAAALEEAERSLPAARLDSPAPNLLFGLDRAESYLLRWNKREVADRASRVRAALAGPRP
jgi:hypothetical protein